VKREEIEALIDTRVAAGIEAAIGGMHEYKVHRDRLAERERERAKGAWIDAFRHGSADERAATLRSLPEEGLSGARHLWRALLDAEDVTAVALAVIADLPADAQRLALKSIKSARNHYDYPKVIVALAPAVPRVRLTLNRGLSSKTAGQRRITEEEAAKLTAAGVRDLLRDDSGVYYTGFEIHAPPNGTQSIVTETTAAWTARLEVDSVLAELVASGVVTVSAMPDEESRIQSLRLYNAGQAPLPELPKAPKAKPAEPFRFGVGPGFDEGALQ
jgi:hypothetical protein